MGLSITGKNLYYTWMHHTCGYHIYTQPETDYELGSRGFPKRQTLESYILNISARFTSLTQSLSLMPFSSFICKFIVGQIGCPATGGFSLWFVAAKRSEKCRNLGKILSPVLHSRPKASQAGLKCNLEMVEIHFKANKPSDFQSTSQKNKGTSYYISGIFGNMLNSIMFQWLLNVFETTDLERVDK